MTDSDIEIDDVEDALRRADELAEVTGRDKADVIADLLDDGKLNLSAGADSETKDFLDVAQEKAEKLKTLLITIAPIIALLSGIGLEGAGILDLTDWGQDSVWDEGSQPPEPPYIDNDIWGCTAYDAENFNPNANRDDGSCYWDDSPPPPVYGCMDSSADNYDPAATQDDGSCNYPPEPCQDVSVSQMQNPTFEWIGESNNAQVVYHLYYTGEEQCDVFVEVMLSLYLDNGYQKTIEYGEMGSFRLTTDTNGEIEIREGRLNGLGEGSWNVETRWRIVGESENCCIQTNTLVVEPEPIETHCDENDISLSNFWSVLGEDNKSVGVAFAINIADGEEVDCTTKPFEIEIRLEYQGNLLAITFQTQDIDTDFEQIEHLFEDLNPGDHAPGVFVRYDDVLVAEGWLWTVNVPEQDVECAIDFYEFYIVYQENNTEALEFYSDPDEINNCGEQITVDVVWTLFDENGTETNLEYRLNTTGFNWDRMSLFTENLTIGNYTAEVELFFVIDGERADDPEKVYTWGQIEIKENDEDE